MRKTNALLLILIFFLPLAAHAELTKEDLNKIETVVRIDVQNENNRLRADLNSDVQGMKTEVMGIMETIKGYQTKDKIVLVITIAAAVVLAESIISILSFLVWRKKRELEKQSALIQAHGGLIIPSNPILPSPKQNTAPDAKPNPNPNIVPNQPSLRSASELKLMKSEFMKMRSELEALAKRNKQLEQKKAKLEERFVSIIKE